MKYLVLLFSTVLSLTTGASYVPRKQEGERQTTLCEAVLEDDEGCYNTAIVQTTGS